MIKIAFPDGKKFDLVIPEKNTRSSDVFNGDAEYNTKLLAIYIMGTICFNLLNQDKRYQDLPNEMKMKAIVPHDNLQFLILSPSTGKHVPIEGYTMRFTKQEARFFAHRQDWAPSVFHIEDKDGTYIPCVDLETYISILNGLDNKFNASVDKKDEIIYFNQLKRDGMNNLLNNLKNKIIQDDFQSTSTNTNIPGKSF